MARLTSVLERYIVFSWAIIGACALVALYWALDRSPPFVLLDYTVLNATRGETAYVNATVERDTGRDCTVNFVRYLVDANKARHDIGGTMYMTAAALQQMERDMPNSLRLAVHIPADVPVGPATLVTALEYRCNPMHALWPIDVLMLIELKVLP